MSDKDEKASLNNRKVFTDSERSTVWAYENMQLDTLNNKLIPFCFNPKNERAVILFPGRRRLSTVAGMYKNTTIPRPIYSKESILPFLANGEVEDALSFCNSLTYGYGVSWRRISAEYSKSVEIGRIIAEFKFDSLKKLHDYIFFERPDLFDELSRRYSYYNMIINNFESVDRLKEINDTLKEGFGKFGQTQQWAGADEFKKNHNQPVW